MTRDWEKVSEFRCGNLYDWLNCIAYSRILELIAVQSTIDCTLEKLKCLFRHAQKPKPSSPNALLNKQATTNADYSLARSIALHHAAASLMFCNSQLELGKPQSGRNRRPSGILCCAGRSVLVKKVTVCHAIAVGGDGIIRTEVTGWHARNRSHGHHVNRFLRP